MAMAIAAAATVLMASCGVMPVLHPIGPAEIVWNKTRDA